MFKRLPEQIRATRPARSRWRLTYRAPEPLCLPSAEVPSSYRPKLCLMGPMRCWCAAWGSGIAASVGVGALGGFSVGLPRFLEGRAPFGVDSGEVLLYRWGVCTERSERFVAAAVIAARVTSAAGAARGARVCAPACAPACAAVRSGVSPWLCFERSPPGFCLCRFWCHGGACARALDGGGASVARRLRAVPWGSRSRRLCRFSACVYAGVVCRPSPNRRTSRGRVRAWCPSSNG